MFSTLFQDYSRMRGSSNDYRRWGFHGLQDDVRSEFCSMHGRTSIYHDVAFLDKRANSRALGVCTRAGTGA